MVDKPRLLYTVHCPHSISSPLPFWGPELFPFFLWARYFLSRSSSNLIRISTSGYIVEFQEYYANIRELDVTAGQRLRTLLFLSDHMPADDVLTLAR